MAKSKSKGTVDSISPFAQHDYQAEDDMRTLMRAHEIKKDKKRHKAARAKAKEHLAKIKAVAAGGDGGDTGAGY